MGFECKMTTQISFQLACLFEREVKDFDRKIEEKVISCFSHTRRTGNDSAHAPARLEKEMEGSNVGLETIPRILERIKLSNLPLLFF